MRFAGTRMEGFLGDDRPNFGEMSQKGLALRNKEETTATDLMGKTAATGISEAGKVEAAGIVGAAQSSLANAQGQASIMSGIGKIGGAFIGAGIDAGGGGLFGNNTNDFSVGDATSFGMSSKQADWLSTPGNYTETVIDGNNVGPTSFNAWDF